MNNSRWLQLSNLSKHKNGYNSLYFTGLSLKFIVVLAESYHPHTVQRHEQIVQDLAILHATELRVLF